MSKKIINVNIEKNQTVTFQNCTFTGTSAEDVLEVLRSSGIFVGASEGILDGAENAPSDSFAHHGAGGKSDPEDDAADEDSGKVDDFLSNWELDSLELESEALIFLKMVEKKIIGGDLIVDSDLKGMSDEQVDMIHAIAGEAKEVNRAMDDAGTRDVSDEAAELRIGNKLRLHSSEAEYLNKRESGIRGKYPDQKRRVAVAFSGGGVRAMCGTIWTLDALKKVGILDRVSYLGGLSGSTWALAPWMTNIMDVNNHWKDAVTDPWTLDAEADAATRARDTVIDMVQEEQSSSGLLDRMLEAVGRVHLPEQLPFTTTTLTGWVRLFFKMVTEPLALAKFGLQIAKMAMRLKRKVSLVWVFGLMLGNALLPPRGPRFELGMSDMQNLLDDEGSLPIPILTAVTQPQGTSTEYHDWVEFTPFEVGMEGRGGDGAFLDSAHFGRLMKAGKNKGKKDNDDRAFHEMGIFGSAFALTVGVVFNLVKGLLEKAAPFGRLLLKFAYDPFGNKLEQKLKQIAEDLSKSKKIIFHGGFVRNPLYKAPISQGSTLFDYTKDKVLEMRDGGMDVNVPVIPFMRPARGVDTVVVIDMSAGVHKEGNGDTIIRGPAERYDTVERSCKGLGIPFDYEDPEGLREVSPGIMMSVFKPKSGANGPIILYVPLTREIQVSEGVTKHPGDALSTFKYHHPKEILEKYKEMVYQLIRDFQHELNEYCS